MPKATQFESGGGAGKRSQSQVFSEQATASLPKKGLRNPEKRQLPKGTCPRKRKYILVKS